MLCLYVQASSEAPPPPGCRLNGRIAAGASAMALGYPVTLIADAHSTRDSAVLRAAQISAHHNETLASITSFGARTTLRRAADIEP